MRRPVFWLTLFFVLGLLTGYRFAVPPSIGFGLAAVLWLTTLFLYRRHHSRTSYFFLLAFFTLGLFYLPARLPTIPVLGDGDYRGTVVSAPDFSSDRVQYRLRITAKDGKALYPPLAVKLTVWQGPQDRVFAPGTRLAFHGEVRLPEGAKNPGGFHYRRYLNGQGLTATVSLANPRLLHAFGKATINPLIPLAYYLKTRLLSALAQRLPGSEYALAAGLVFGETGNLPASVMDYFADTGTIHILSVSGLHVGFVMAMALALCAPFKNPRLSFLITVPLLFFYALLTGAAPPVVRSAIMGTLYLLGNMLDRESDGLNTLALAALCILLFTPWAVLDIGFILSFSAMAGLILFTPPLSKKLSFLPDKLSAIAAGSVAAQLATWPFSLQYFQRLALWAPLANLVIVPVAGVATLMGLIGAAFSLLVPALGSLLLTVSRLPLALLLGSARLFSSFPGASLWLPHPTGFSLVCYALLLLCTFGTGLSLRPKHRRLLAGTMAAVLIFSFYIPRQPAHLLLTFLDVGEGDSLLIRTPEGHAILIDGGGAPAGSNFDIGERVLLPALGELGVRRLSAVVITHPHGDHYGGLFAVGRRIPVGEVWVGPGTGDQGYQDLLRLFAERRIPIRKATAGKELVLGKGVRCTVLFPPPHHPEDNPNNQSLVLRVTYGKTSFLLTGDLETEGENFLLRDRPLLRADVLKIGHHGSATSTGWPFLRAVSPKIAILSVGRNNFGHPSAEVLARLKEQGVVLLRTDEKGAITLHSDGRQIWWETWLS